MTDAWCLERRCTRRPLLASARRAGFIIGLASLGTGGLAMAVIRYHLKMADRWPAVLVASGVVLFILAVPLRRPAEEWLALLGTATVVAGGVVWYQHDTGRWASWAYAWTLVIPGAVGLWLLVLGAVSDTYRHAIWPGIRLLGVTAALFASGALLFEGVFRLDAFEPLHWQGYLFPGILAAVGVAALVLTGIQAMQGRRRS